MQRPTIRSADLLPECTIGQVAYNGAAMCSAVLIPAWFPVHNPDVSFQFGHKVLRLVTESAEGWNQINAPRLGAALAFYTTLSLAPLVVICVSLAGIFLGPSAAEGRISEEVRQLAGPAVQGALKLLLLHSGKSSGIIASLVGLATLWF